MSKARGRLWGCWAALARQALRLGVAATSPEAGFTITSSPAASRSQRRGYVSHRDVIGDSNALPRMAHLR